MNSTFQVLLSNHRGGHWFPLPLLKKILGRSSTLFLLSSIVWLAVPLKAQYAGSYQGSWNGGVEDVGDWTAIIDGSGNLTATMSNRLPPLIDYGIGTVSRTGVLRMVFTYQQLKFEGQIGDQGSVSGVCDVVSSAEMGKFTGDRIGEDPKITIEQPAGYSLSDNDGSLSFGDISVGSTASLTFTIVNMGGSPLVGLAVTKNGINPADFTVTGPSESTLNAGARSTFTVVFSPSAAGTRTASLHIASNDETYGHNPFDVNLTGGKVGRLFQGELYDGGNEPKQLTTGDFNGDGKPDVAVANLNSSTITVRLNSGTDTFLPQRLFPVGNRPNSIIKGDFNGDGKADLVTANSASGDISVLLGNGDGTFLPQRRFIAGDEANSVATGDFNGDGKTDLVSACGIFGKQIGEVNVLLGNGDGMFQSPRRFVTGMCPNSVATGDFNGDNKDDIATANTGNSGNVNHDSGVTILAGNGDGTFQGRIRVAWYDSFYSVPESLISCDFNSDGLDDLAVIDYASGTYILLNTGGAYFQIRGSFGNDYARSIVACDFNQDSKPDLAVSIDGYDCANILIGNGDGTFHIGSTMSDAMGFKSVAVDDIDGDGKTDLIGLAGGGFEVIFGNGDGTLQSPTIIEASRIPLEVISGDFNGDRKADIAMVHHTSLSSSIIVQVGGGDGTFRATLSFPVGVDPSSLTTGDFNGDGKTDLVTANVGSNDISVMIGNGDATFQSELRYPMGASPMAVTSGDFNGDGVVDLAAANSSSSEVSVRFGRGDGTFQSRRRVTVETGSNGLAVGDFNDDGRCDLITGSFVLLLGNADGTFQTQSLGTGLDHSPVVDDFNNDGKADISALAREGTAVLLGNGDGTFQPARLWEFGGPTIAGDFNNDGNIDLASAGGSSVSILPGNGDGTFQPQRLFVRCCEALAVGDFNGDNRPDFVTIDGINNEFSISLNINTLNILTDNTYLSWIKYYFPIAWLDPVLERYTWGDHADPDGDGCDNLMEFVMARNPTESDIQYCPACAVDELDFVVTFRETTALGHDISWAGQWSNDMSIWMTDGIRYSVLQTHSSYRLIEARVRRSGEQHQFFRLRVER